MFEIRNNGFYRNIELTSKLERCHWSVAECFRNRLAASVGHRYV
jgi:hypothetical protein